MGERELFWRDLERLQNWDSSARERQGAVFNGEAGHASEIIDRITWSNYLQRRNSGRHGIQEDQKHRNKFSDDQENCPQR